MLLPFTCAAQKPHIRAAVLGAVTAGATNLAAGIELAIGEFQNLSYDPLCADYIVVTTDGIPTTSLLPPEGLKTFVAERVGGLAWPVHLTAIGIGPSVDSALLVDVVGNSGFFCTCRTLGALGRLW